MLQMFNVAPAFALALPLLAWFAPKPATVPATPAARTATAVLGSAPTALQETSTQPCACAADFNGFYVQGSCDCTATPLGLVITFAPCTPVPGCINDGGQCKVEYDMRFECEDPPLGYIYEDQVMSASCSLAASLLYRCIEGGSDIFVAELVCADSCTPQPQ